jgi:hypothetical protein
MSGTGRTGGENSAICGEQARMDRCYNRGFNMVNVWEMVCKMGSR